MQPLHSPRVAAVAAAVLIPLLIATAAVSLGHAPSGSETVSGPVEHLQLAGLSLMLAVLVPITLLLGDRTGSRRAAAIAVAGMCGLSVVCVASNIHGRDDAIFPPVAIAPNLAWFGADVALAIAAARRGVLPRALAVAMPLGWIALLLLSRAGGGLLVAILWFAIGRELGFWAVPARRVTRPIGA